jgi:hypothetical protein
MQNDRLLQTFSGEKPDFGHFPDIFVRDAPFPGGNLMKEYKDKSELKEKTSSLTGNIVYQEFYPRQSKALLDHIDSVLARHYGFTEEELEFILNYDIKYRLGREGEGDDE